MHVSTIARRTVLGALLLASAAPARAQTAIYGAGLQAWAGCWSAEAVAAAEPAPIICVTPTADVNVSEVITLQDGETLSRQILDASGRPRAIDAKGCVGTRSATWSRDGRRLFVRSTGSCLGVPRETSSILAITPSGEWLDVEGIRAGGGMRVRVARFRDVGIPRTLPRALATTLRAQHLATESMRIAAGAPVRADDVLEAARIADSAVVEAWILERAHQFAITERDLGALAQGGLPARVADALIAVADPEGYTLARGDETYARGMGVAGAGEMPLALDSYASPWAWGWSYYTPYGLRRGAGISYRGRGYPGFYRPPVIIVNRRNGGVHRREGGGYGDSRGGDRDGARGSGRGRGSGSTGAATQGDPRHPDRPAGATLRLGKPRG